MLRAFILGGTLYPLIELLYRGRTHYSMALAGGLAACLVRRVDMRMRNAPVWAGALICGLGVTAIEYAVGACWNRRHKVWDYRKERFNLRGQICPRFTLVWCGLCGLALLSMRLSRRLSA